MAGGAKRAAGAAGKKKVKRSTADGAAAGGTKSLAAAGQEATAAAAADVMAALKAEEKARVSAAFGTATGGDAPDDGSAPPPPGAGNSAAETTALLRSMGEHIDTRRVGEDMEVDDEGVGAGVYDETGESDDEVDESFRPLAAAVPAERVELVSAQVAAQQLESGNLFIGHNRNSVTAVACHGNSVVYADKLGVVTKVTLPSRQSFAEPSREMFLPHVDSPVLCIAISDTSASRRNQGLTRTTADLSITSFVAVGTARGMVRIWNLDTMAHVGDLTLHRSAVTSAVFRMNTSTLLTVSQDKVVRAWNVHAMAPLDRYFGHQAGINAVATLRSERAVSCGDDRTPHLWKLDRATQVAYQQQPTPCDAIALLDDGSFVVGCRSGSILLFDAMRKSPVWRTEFAHGYGWGGDGTGLERDGRTTRERFGTTEAPAAANEAFGNGITALRCVPFSDLLVSGSYDGYVRIWRYRSPEFDSDVSSKCLELVGQAAVFGFVNSIDFAYDGKEIVVGVGKEPRMGRWLVQRNARNGVQRIPLAGTGAVARRSGPEERPVEATDPKAERAKMLQLLQQARAPTQRETTIRDRKQQAESAASAAAAKKKKANKAAEAKSSTPSRTPKASVGASSPQQTPLVAPPPPPSAYEQQTPGSGEASSAKKKKSAVREAASSASPVAATPKRSSTAAIAGTSSSGSGKKKMQQQSSSALKKKKGSASPA